MSCLRSLEVASAMSRVAVKKNSLFAPAVVDRNVKTKESNVKFSASKGENN